MRNPLPNLRVAAEPDYEIRMDWPDGRREHVSINKRCFWKRLSAINHARHLARRNPMATVTVYLADHERE
jgi:hypothetical protein